MTSRFMSARLATLLAVAAVAAFAVACGGGAVRSLPTSTAKSSVSAKQVLSSRPARPGQLAPDFVMPVARANGDRLVPDVYSLSNRNGPVVLYFSFVG
ncbi:MAG: hypothetical protein HY678_06725 [Chloroflexi bacterium]|nr:hypothetical protein [Chloroflexota bacterium]